MTEETRHSPVNGDGTPAPDSEQTSETVPGSAIASAFGESPPPQASTVVSSKPKLKRNRIVL
ncbi:hypothetical protein EWM64_g2204 [Hericium alpestre]|uniref:Uncharacterized protein n=1 Tax=Hericium alpestre TaxID=135208 RepID=A0A4Z0A608_9AGAM|nr:hypothetical protein EWM64_g2204 [Hericium alpestre]